jgi:hypothetical protein
MPKQIKNQLRAGATYLGAIFVLGMINRVFIHDNNFFNAVVIGSVAVTSVASIIE